MVFLARRLRCERAWRLVGALFGAGPGQGSYASTRARCSLKSELRQTRSSFRELASHSSLD